MNTSIIEQVESIKKANTPLSSKKRALLALGLTKHDVDLVMTQLEIQGFTYQPAVTRQRAAFTFGVEIECDVYRARLEAEAAQTGFAHYYHTAGYSTCHIDNHRTFKFVSDGSLCGNSPIEAVSPVLSGRDGKAALKLACDTLRRAGAVVNRTCGLHVHIGAAGLTGEQYANVFVNYYYLESLIDSFMAPSRRNNTYARGLQGCCVSRMTDRASVQREMHHDRYYKVNCMSYERHKTIEFRQHQGTTNFTKIFNWVMFCGKLVEWSKTHRLAARVTSVDDIEFLTKAEKKFFNKRIEEFSGR